MDHTDHLSLADQFTIACLVLLVLALALAWRRRIGRSTRAEALSARHGGARGAAALHPAVELLREDLGFERRGRGARSELVGRVDDRVIVVTQVSGDALCLAVELVDPPRASLDTRRVPVFDGPTLDVLAVRSDRVEAQVGAIVAAGGWLSRDAASSRLALFVPAGRLTHELISDLVALAASLDGGGLGLVARALDNAVTSDDPDHRVRAPLAVVLGSGAEPSDAERARAWRLLEAEVTPGLDREGVLVELALGGGREVAVLAAEALACWGGPRAARALRRESADAAVGEARRAAVAVILGRLDDGDDATADDLDEVDRDADADGDGAPLRDDASQAAA